MSEDAQSECIYNILGKKNKKKQEGLYRSKYPHNIAPTGSTFINRNTTRPGVANLAGEFKLFKGGHEYKFQTQTFGKPKGQNKQDPHEFQRRAGDTQQGQNNVFRIKKGGPYKDQVPKFDKAEELLNKENEQKKNFVVSNAIDIAMMQVPMKKPTLSQDNQKQKDYGKVPKYLETVKQDIEKEYRVYQRNMRILRGETESNKSIQPTREELIKKREKLKDQWTETYNKYSKMAHKTKFDTLIEKEKKAGYERELNQLEVEIRNLKAAILVAQK